MDCPALVVHSKVVAHPVCVHIHIRAVAGRRPHIRCDGVCGGLLDWSLKSTSHWRCRQHANAGDCIKNLALLDFTVNHRKSQLTMFEYRRWYSSAVNGSRRHQWVRTLLKSSNARFLRPSPHLHTCECHQQRSNGTISCRIISWYFVQYRIVSIVFPHGHIVPSLIKCWVISSNVCYKRCSETYSCCISIVKATAVFQLYFACVCFCLYLSE